MFASVAGELVTPRIAARFGYRRLLVVGLVLLGAPAFALAWVTDLGTMLLVGLVRGLGFAVVVTATGALAASTLPVERRGEGLGLLGVVSMVPAVTALPAGVWLAEGLGSSAAFALGAVVVLAVVPVTLGLPRDAAGDGRTPSTAASARSSAGPAPCPGCRLRGGRRRRRCGRDLPARRRLRPRRTRRAGPVRAGAGRDPHPLLRRPLVRPPRPARPARPRHGAGRHRDGPGRADRQPGRRTARDGGLRRRLRPGADGLAEPDARGRDARASTARCRRVWNVAYDLGWGLGAAVVGLLVTSRRHPRRLRRHRRRRLSRCCPWPPRRRAQHRGGGE